MALYRGSVKVSGIGKGLPSGGEEGQVLVKTASGEARGTIESGASDHLEEKALVGELYTLNDKVFIQATPTLENSTIDQEVGNVADNTQIHIQRIASGNASNELKLKIKKMGTPGDLTVQVMKGISVTVTTDVEAYWYGDSNNVLASGTVLASDITTSYQEITVNLGASVGGTKGDLLDIVLSQSSVNASNYYVIACDSTQWSEGFSFVSVNGDTRTRSKLMPYCVSDGFADSILSKATDDTYNILSKYGETPYISGKQEINISYGYWGWMNINSYIYLAPGTYIVKVPDMNGFLMDYYLQNPATYKDRLTEGIIDSNRNVLANRGTQADFSAWEVEVTVTNGANYYFGFYNPTTGYIRFQGFAPYIPAIPVYSKNSASKVNYTPKDVKVYDEVSLGGEITAYSFGRLPDKSWWDGGILNGVGGLPLEFVEKRTITKSSSGSVTLSPFDYPVFIIADCVYGGKSVAGTLKCHTSSMGSEYLPNDSRYQRVMDSGFFPAGSDVIYYNGYNNSTLYVRIYKVNLPE